MPLDAVFLSALTEELNRTAAGAHVDRIRMPERDTILLSLRTASGPSTLLLCAGTGDARLHLTRGSFENPPQPPMFCMLLRKHLVNAVLASVEQIPGERTAVLRFSCRDLFEEGREKKLILEMMGRYSNLILVGDDGIILDCLRRIDFTESEKRPLIPGLRYETPPLQEGKTAFASLRDERDFPVPDPQEAGMPADKWLIRRLSGISPLMCREIAFAACGEIDAPVNGATAAALAAAAVAASGKAAAGEQSPWILADAEGIPRDFYGFPVRQYGAAMTLQREGSYSELLDRFYGERAAADRMRQKAAGLTRTVRNARDRTERKLVAQREEWQRTQDRETLRRQGDIVSANLYRVKRGDTVLRAEDFYDPEGRECEIPLDPAKTPQQNAADYYRRYAKAKHAETVLAEQLESGTKELAYLNSVLDEIGRASGEKDLAEIREELTLTGYVKESRGKDRRRKKTDGFLRFLSSTGLEIRVGRNNLQNDELTLRRSSKNDIWLHTKNFHGSHTVISCEGGEPDEKTLTEAAVLAALYSEASGGSRVPVDYTRVRYVKKPNGARPGMVTYTDYRTVYVTPDRDLAEKLKQPR